MPTVTGTILTPAGQPVAGATVAFSLVDLTRAWRSSDSATVISRMSTETDVNGVYELDLVGNTDLAPENSVYRRSVEFGGAARRGVAPFYDDLIVPSAGGPYDEFDLLVDPLPPLTAPTPTNDRDRAELDTAAGPFVVNVLTWAAVPGLVVDVPDLDVPIYVVSRCLLQHTIASSFAGLIVAPVGSAFGATPSDVAQVRTGPAGTTGKVVARAELYLEANSPGQYQAFVTGDTGSITVAASTSSVASLVARTA